jgi:hypothetical protein
MIARNNNVVVVTVVAVVSAAVAFVTYGLLDSTGATEHAGLRLGGAVVGFVVAFTLLASLLKWLYTSDVNSELVGARQELRELGAKNDALSSQLIRGLTLPDGYVAEVLDQHKLVMARPGSFVSRGGVILDIIARPRDEANGIDRSFDAVPARLYVNFQPAEDDDPDAYYRAYCERASANPRFRLMGLERTFIGLEERPRPALKVSTLSVASVSISRDPYAEKLKTSSQLLKHADWPAPECLDSAHVVVTAAEMQDPGFERRIIVAMRTTMVVCLHPQLKRVFFFVFEDDEKDFTEAVESLHCCLRSVRFLN